MAENENVVNNGSAIEPQKTKGQKFKAGLKEWWRKFLVGLKRRPTKIPFFILVISTIVILCSLGNLSQLGLSNEYSLQMQGMCVFVDILFSILIVVLFMNAFPKRSKKPKTVTIILLFVFMAILVAVDIYLFIVWGNNHKADLIRTANYSEADYNAYWNGTDTTNGINDFYPGAMAGIMAHLILLAISAVLTATYPLYGKLLLKVNTRKSVESTEFKEAIDTSEEV